VTGQRATFLKLLLNSPNKPVLLKSFKDAGIPNPKKLESDLLRRMNKKGVGMIISATKGAYILAVPQAD